MGYEFSVLPGGDVSSREAGGGRGGGMVSPWTMWNKPASFRIAQQLWESSDSEEDILPDESSVAIRRGLDDELLWQSSDLQECNCHCQVSGCRFCDIKSDKFSTVEDLDQDGFWIKALHLKNSDRAELLAGDMLSDKHIFAAQKLLSQQFPDVGGFQDSCLSQTTFLPVHQNFSVQIHHTRTNHWVVSSWTRGDVVEIYDSIYDRPAEDLLRQLSHIYAEAPRDNDGNVLYRMCKVQKQRGSKDCALFAIAYAYELCLGYDIEGIIFDQSKMRGHLVKCLEDGSGIQSFLPT